MEIESNEFIVFFSCNESFRELYQLLYISIQIWLFAKLICDCDYQHEICVHTFHKGTPTVTRNPPWAMWPVLTEAQSSISYHKKSHPRKSQKRVCKSTLGLQTLHFQILNNRANPKIQIKRIEIPTLCSSISLTQNETKLNKIIYQLI